ncbi:MAG: hypothetical protein GWP19_06215 [Planctomycetia bacterium]|nr:hypothetical protein [Planctomycetia bacterium]
MEQAQWLVLSLGKGTRDYAWSPDSKTIAFKQKTVEESKRISNTLHTFNVKTKQSTLLKTDVPGHGFLRWADRGIEVKSVVPVKNRETGSFEIVNKVFDVSDEEFRQSNDPIVYYDQIDNKHFVIVEDGNGNVLSKTGGYILPIMSPKNDKFLATRSARTYVLNLSGEILTNLGYADNEMWSEDGELIIYQIGEAGGWHGQTLIGSEIFVINIDGTDKNQLTHTPDIIEMKPHWSGNASKITYFDESTGKIFVSVLEYEE